MREIIEIPLDKVKPNRSDVLRTQGVTPGKYPSRNVEKPLRKAIELFLGYAHPIGVVADIPRPLFEDVYKGDGKNETSTPLDEIFRKAEALALFAVTIGEEVSQKISQLFQKNELVLGSMLDGAASVGVDNAADVIEKHFLTILVKRGTATSTTTVLRYSPGYCGWHMSGQKKLFTYLKPEDIGISLLDSFLMRPLKSISGVLIAGPREIHVFEDSYPFCSECKTHSCRERIEALFKESRNNNRV